jgi:hypothetical protein
MTPHKTAYPLRLATTAANVVAGYFVSASPASTEKTLSSPEMMMS